MRIVEQHSEQSTQTFPVGLRPGSLRILSSLGLTEALYWRGRPINQLAVLDLPKAAGISWGALTLPQDILRKEAQRRDSNDKTRRWHSGAHRDQYQVRTWSGL